MDKDIDLVAVQYKKRMGEPGVRPREPTRRARGLLAVLAWLALGLQDLPRVTGAGDPCTALYFRLEKNQQYTTSGSSYIFARPTEVIPCTHTVLFNANRDLSNLRSVYKYFINFYGLIKIARRAPDPRVPSYYDVAASLRWIGTRKWRYAEDFYTAMSNAVAKLNDAHTGLQLECPPFYHSLALPLVGVMENGRPVVRVAPGSILSGFITTGAAANAPFRFNVRAYAGAKVLTINGRSAWSYMVWWANNFAGGYHDGGQKLNNAFASVSWTGSQLGANPGTFSFRTNNPKRNYVPMRLIRQGRTKAEVVQVPWITWTFGEFLSSFQDKDWYYQGFCKKQASDLNAQRPLDSFSPSRFFQNSGLSTNASESLDALGSVEVHGAENQTKGMAFRRAATGSPVRRMQRREVVPPGFSLPIENPLEAPAVNGLTAPSKPAATRLSNTGFMFPVYLLRDGKTGVVVLSTFNADGNNAPELLIAEAAKSFNLVNQHAKQVIVDLTNNGGGILQVGYWMITLLMGSDRFPRPRTQMQDYKQFLADTSFVLQMRNLNTQWYNWRGYEDIYERDYTPATASRFFRPTRAERFGKKGFVGRYSSDFKSDMTTLAEALGRGVGPALGSKRFLLFSNGLCFSTCQNFAFTLRRRFGVLLAGIGGQPRRPLQFSGGGGGFILSSVEDNMLPTIPPQLRSRPDAPQRFTMRISLGMKFPLGTYALNSKAPMEFTYLPADKKIGYTMANVGNPAAQWLQVAKMFN